MGNYGAVHESATVRRKNQIAGHADAWPEDSLRFPLWSKGAGFRCSTQFR